MLAFPNSPLAGLKAVLSLRLFYIIGGVLITSLLLGRILGSTKFTAVPRPSWHVDSSWNFDPERDAHNYGLTSDQCDIAFPGLFDAIDHVVERRRSKPITKAELTRESWPAGTIRVLVWEQQVSWTRDASRARAAVCARP